MTLRDKVQWVVDSDITTYQFAKETGLANSVIVRLRSGERSIGKMSLDVAEKIGALYDSRN